MHWSRQSSKQTIGVGGIMVILKRFEQIVSKKRRKLILQERSKMNEGTDQLQTPREYDGYDYYTPIATKL